MNSIFILAKSIIYYTTERSIFSTDPSAIIIICNSTPHCSPETIACMHHNYNLNYI